MHPITDTVCINKDEIHGFCLIKVELDDNDKVADCTFLYVNEELAKFKGKSQNQLTNQNLLEIFPNNKWLDFYYEAAYLNKSVSFEDTKMNLHIEVYPIGHVGCCACVICDIKEEEILKAYKEEEERNIQIHHYAKAIGIVYPLIISMDYMANSYEMVEYDNFLNRTAANSGTIDDLINVGTSTIPDPKIAKEFASLFNREAAIKAFRQGKKELTLRHPQNGDDGKIHYMDTHVICTECSNDKVTAISMAKCIDEEAERDNALLKANEHAEVINALTTIYTTIMEADLLTHAYKIIQTNSPMKMVVGGKDQGNFDEVMEDVLKFYMHPNDIDRMRDFINLKTLSSRMGSDTTLVTEYKAAYGKWFEARFIAKKRDEKGHVISAIYAARDVTPEKLKELHYREQLKEQLMISNTLARNFKNVYLIDLEKKTAKILKLEAGYEKLQEEIGHEFPFDAVLKHWTNNVVSANDRSKIAKIFTVENVKKHLSKEKEFTGNYQSKANGETHYFQYSMSMADNDGTKAILGFQNIDNIIHAQLKEEEKRRKIEQAYQEDLKKAKEAAERANRAKTDFLLRMSHDIRTPLNGIRGMLDIADHYGNDMEKVKECRAKVRESSNILLELINEVLDMSKLETGEVVLEQIPFDLTNVSFEVFTVIEKMAEEQDIEIKENSKVTHTRFIGSPIHLKRLLLNILSNAIKYNRPHGKVFVSCNEISFDGKTAIIETIISDTGIGMSKEFQKHLFEPFQQENASARTKYGGTGLGMSISKSLVEKMGGTITFESEKNKGTTFTIQIPLEVDFSKHIDVAKDNKENVSIAGETIILAEDNNINMEIAQFILKNAGVNIIEAQNGKEAVSAFAMSKEGEVSAILMDLMMPVVDGYEATRRIRSMDRKDAKTIPIIAMTANAFVEDRIATKKAGMNAHIAKPLNDKEVINVIAEQIKESKSF